jgi:hypothetical protein
MLKANRTEKEVKNLPTRIASKKSSSANKLPSIKCSSCGAEIVLVQNVKLVSEAVEAHVESHRSKIKNPIRSEAEAERIRDDLITQVFKTAGEHEFARNSKRAC